MCRQLCYLMSYMLHTLMLSNTVHTGFGQRLCRMDNPEMIIEMWVCLKEKLPCSMLERKAIAMLNRVHGFEDILMSRNNFVGIFYMHRHERP